MNGRMSSRRGTVYFYQSTAPQPGMPRPKKKRLAPSRRELAGPVAKSWPAQSCAPPFFGDVCFYSHSDRFRFISSLLDLTLSHIPSTVTHFSSGVLHSTIIHHSLFHLRHLSRYIPSVSYVLSILYLLHALFPSTLHDMSMIPSMQFPPEAEEAACLINGLRNRITPDSDMELNCAPILLHSLCRLPPPILLQAGSRSRDSTMFVSRSTAFTHLIPSTPPSPMPLP